MIAGRLRAPAGRRPASLLGYHARLFSCRSPGLTVRLPLPHRIFLFAGLCLALLPTWVIAQVDPAALYEGEAPVSDQS